MEVRAVKPREPTVCLDQTFHSLPDISLMPGFKVDTAHVVPGPIDLDQFTNALALTLSVFPVYAGRLERPDITEPWRVRLTNDAVPVVVITSDADAEVPSNTVVQSPFTLTRGVDLSRHMENDAAEPFMRVTITKFTKTGCTSIGFCTSHLIGDGWQMLQFARLVSQNYLGLPPLDPPPIYEHPAPYPFNSEDYGDVFTPEFQHFYHYKDTPPHLDISRKKPIRSDFRLTAMQVAQIQKGIIAQCPNDKPPIISRQDAIVALLADSVSKSEPDSPPVQHINTIFMNRGIPPHSATAFGNGLLWAMTDAAEDYEQETPFTIALRVRKSLVRLRDPGYAAAYVAKGSKLARKAMDSGLFQDFIPRPGYMTINSTWR
ncbi:hypothetical protein PHLGIDRAFT_19573 [Phlebiopsis gigantea 11061_1 CR5-6]|uniref:Uncharacterized protein n=1 Tax=Phlebiopsis gigantea (strain 11061_1 CR5-6) TaxID=745531 RepID=A0A0C3RWI3_PHLG1|nr:hypothetical protein PHLGIDRAFT_19573 [Phlebiopsis gigantea 11061_1 CR5-6]